MVNVLVLGTGEYVTGFVNGAKSDSDKPIGVIGITLFDMKRRGLIDNVTLVGTNGTKFPEIRKHFQQRIGNVYKDMDVSFRSYPADDCKRDVEAYKKAIKEQLNPGDAVLIFTPDHIHHEQARFAIEQGCHVLIAKPLVQKYEHHKELESLAREKGVIVACEVHKRWDPMYADAWYKISHQIEEFGHFSYYTSYMSQPVSQLSTFSSWIQHSDISYYLNAHHIDFHTWALTSIKNADWRPVQVTAVGSEGVANEYKDIGVKYDSITLLTKWKDFSKESVVGTAVYTSSWIGQKKNDVHSQQRFFYQGSKSEITIDQAHRGYIQVNPSSGYKSVNPLFMKYTPDYKGHFAGQSGYGYKSIETFVSSITEANKLERASDRIAVGDANLASVTSLSTRYTTQILEAGFISLQKDGLPCSISSA